MNFVEKKEIKNTNERQQLKEANRAYTECISKEFLGRFLAGDKVNADDFCISERSAMKSLDEKLYGPLQI
jgi:hypothetical protein